MTQNSAPKKTKPRSFWSFGSFVWFPEIDLHFDGLKLKVIVIMLMVRFTFCSVKNNISCSNSWIEGSNFIYKKIQVRMECSTNTKRLVWNSAYECLFRHFRSSLCFVVLSLSYLSLLFFFFVRFTILLGIHYHLFWWWWIRWLFMCDGWLQISIRIFVVYVFKWRTERGEERNKSFATFGIAERKSPIQQNKQTKQRRQQFNYIFTLFASNETHTHTHTDNWSNSIENHKMRIFFFVFFFLLHMSRIRQRLRR